MDFEVLYILIKTGAVIEIKITEEKPIDLGDIIFSA